MDGRDLLYEVFPKYTQETELYEIANELPAFIAKIVNSIGNKFYGRFHLGSMYDLNNFDNMIVSKNSFLFILYIFYFLM